MRNVNKLKRFVYLLAVLMILLCSYADLSMTAF